MMAWILEISESNCLRELQGSHICESIIIFNNDPTQSSQDIRFCSLINCGSRKTWWIGISLCLGKYRGNCQLRENLWSSEFCKSIERPLNFWVKKKKKKRSKSGLQWRPWLGGVSGWVAPWVSSVRSYYAQSVGYIKKNHIIDRRQCCRDCIFWDRFQI